MPLFANFAADPARARELYEKASSKLHASVDGMFVWLLFAEWIFAVVLAAATSPYSYAGRARELHIHLQLAVFFGLAINALPLWLIRHRPGTSATRISISVAQGLWSGMLIHLSGGRVETHFHIFGSLAMLAFYRDWRVFMPATLIAAADHFVRGTWYPESIFGTVRVQNLRFLEHVGWVAFEVLFLIIGCVRADRELREGAKREAKMEAAHEHIRGSNQLAERMVIERTQELEESRKQYQLIAEGTDAIPFAFRVDERRFSYIGPQVAHVFGWPAARWFEPGFIETVLPRDQLARLHEIAGAQAGQRLQIELGANSLAGKPVVVRLIMNVREEPGSRWLIGLMLDITSLRHLETELRQAQKLESVGRLAAGVAHEINTPVQFVSDSIHFARNGVRDLIPLLARYRALEDAVAAGAAPPEQAAELAGEREQVDFDYLVQHLPGALDRSLEGLGRVADIVASMKQFAHPDQKEMVDADLNRAVESTLTIARGEYKLFADVETRLGAIPLVACYLGEVNQVLLNILINAAHAIEDVVRGTERRGKIVIETVQDGDSVVLSISDTGGGIPAALHERIFDPFFTTKEVGRGTGQGLAIARSVVQDKHGGALTFETAMGVGTTFHIRLPIRAARPERKPVASSAQAEMPLMLG